MGALRSVHRGLAKRRHSKTLVTVAILFLIWSTTFFFYRSSDALRIGSLLAPDGADSHPAGGKHKADVQAPTEPTSLAPELDSTAKTSPTSAPISASEPATKTEPDASEPEEQEQEAEATETPTPANPVSTIPKKLWYKLGPQGLTHQAHGWTNTCTQQNPDYEVQFLTEEGGDAYVKKQFGESHPDLVEIYLNLSVPIWKADMLRYLLLYSEGGVYNDLDVTCHEPIDNWIPKEFGDEAAVVAGWEFDFGLGTGFIHEFASWTIMAKQGSPRMWAVIEDILQSIREGMEQYQVPVEGLTLEMMGDVVDFTGPRRLTNSIVRTLSETRKTTKDVILAEIEYLPQPKMVEDVLVLPGWAFAYTANHFENDLDEIPGPYVLHHYAGSWKNDKGGEDV